MSLRCCGHIGGLREFPGFVVELWFAASSRTWSGSPKLEGGAADCLQWRGGAGCWSASAGVYCMASASWLGSSVACRCGSGLVEVWRWDERRPVTRLGFTRGGVVKSLLDCEDSTWRLGQLLCNLQKSGMPVLTERLVTEGNLYKARAGHLRIDIHESNHNRIHWNITRVSEPVYKYKTLKYLLYTQIYSIKILNFNILYFVSVHWFKYFCNISKYIIL